MHSSQDHLEKRLFHPPGTLDGQSPSGFEDVLEDRVSVVDIVRAQRPPHSSPPRPIVFFAHGQRQSENTIDNTPAS